MDQQERFEENQQNAIDIIKSLLPESGVKAYYSEYLAMDGQAQYGHMTMSGVTELNFSLTTDLNLRDHVQDLLITPKFKNATLYTTSLRREGETYKFYISYRLYNYVKFMQELKDLHRKQYDISFTEVLEEECKS